MAKDNIRDYDTSAAGNTDIGGIGIEGTNAVSNFDGAFREAMAQLARWNAGTSAIEDTATFCDPADNTKAYRLDAGGISTATTRVLTVPNASGTLPLLGLAQTWSAVQTYTANLNYTGSRGIFNTASGATSDAFVVSSGSATTSAEGAWLFLAGASHPTTPGIAVLTSGAGGNLFLRNAGTTVATVLPTGINISGEGEADVLKSATNVLSSGLTSATDFAAAATPGHYLGTSTTASGFSRGGGPAGAVQRNVSNGTAWLWFRATTQVGDVSVTATATTYNTTSDGRLKSNQVPLESVVDPGVIIDALQPKKYVWNHVPGGIEGVGFIAQEVEQILPECVNVGDSDPNKRPGDEGFEQWSGSWTPMIPYLVAEIKALRARVSALEAASNA